MLMPSIGMIYIWYSDLGVDSVYVAVQLPALDAPLLCNFQDWVIPMAEQHDNSHWTSLQSNHFALVLSHPVVAMLIDAL
jgi:hypothetical protein